MNVKSVSALWFSPTGGTKAVTRDIAGALAEGGAAEYDLTVSAQRLSFGAEDVAVFGVPVFGGRVPASALERIATLKGDGTPAVLVAVFGNRAVDDALLELGDALKKQGFRAVAAGGFVARHSVCPEFGAGRPDGRDKAAQAAFAQAVKAKLALDGAPAEVSLPGNRPFRKYDGIPVKPEVSLIKCGKCGACAKNCPVGAIPLSDPRKTDKKKCISCMRCISVCPHYARHVNPVIALAAKKTMAKFCTQRREAETYI